MCTSRVPRRWLWRIHRGEGEIAPPPDSLPKVLLDTILYFKSHQNQQRPGRASYQPPLWGLTALIRTPYIAGGKWGWLTIPRTPSPLRPFGIERRPFGPRRLPRQPLLSQSLWVRLWQMMQKRKRLVMTGLEQRKNLAAR